MGRNVHVFLFVLEKDEAHINGRSSFFTRTPFGNGVCFLSHVRVGQRHGNLPYGGTEARFLAERYQKVADPCEHGDLCVIWGLITHILSQLSSAVDGATHHSFIS